MTTEANLRVIADDLTGAADAGVAFAEERRPVPLVLHPHATAWNNQWSGVVVADAALRDAEPAVARSAFASLVEDAAGYQLFNKVDSMLRGHVRAQLEVLHESVPDGLLLVATAFPRAGRVTRQGVQYVDGVPLHRSGKWSAGYGEPPRSIRELLGSLPSMHVGLSAVRTGDQELGAALERAEAEGSILLFDAETDKDLDRIVVAGGLYQGRVVWVGSAGLAGALARARAPFSHEAPAVPPVARRSTGPCLAVIGSASDAARRQARRLAMHQGAALVELPGETLAGGDPAVLEALSRRLLAQAATGCVVAAVRGPVTPEAASAIQSSLAGAVTPLVARSSTVILVGGATARAVMDACSVRVLDLVTELEPGVVLAHPDGNTDVDVITKAGTFGDDLTLVRALHRATRRRSSR